MKTKDSKIKEEEERKNLNREQQNVTGAIVNFKKIVLMFQKTYATPGFYVSQDEYICEKGKPSVVCVSWIT